ncbi:MAG TPA: hypothetical protein VH370_27290 [Humisphaera sp.]|jgi:hypothetical protein|nr:hypothetical protein [Humisphaera sp.]
MGLALALKRVNRLYHPSPRRWIRRNYLFIFFYVTGLFTGTYIHVESKVMMIWAIAIYFALYALRWWAGWDLKSDSPSQANDALPHRVPS